MSRYRFTIGPDSTYLSDTFATFDAALVELRRKSRHLPVTIHLHDTATSPHLVRCWAHAGALTWMVDCRACRATGKTGALVCAKCSGGGRVADHG